MSVQELISLEIQEDMEIYREQILEERKGDSKGPAFAYEDGKALLHSAYYRIISSTSQKVLGRTLGYHGFQKYIQSGSE